MDGGLGVCDPLYDDGGGGVEKALLLMRFHVPRGALAYVFGRDAMYWYRLEQTVGRFSGVGTPVKAPERLTV